MGQSLAKYIARHELHILSGMRRRLLKTSRSTECHSLKPRQFLQIHCRVQFSILYIPKKKRFVIHGQSGLQHTLVVVHTYRGEDSDLALAPDGYVLQLLEILMIKQLGSLSRPW